MSLVQISLAYGALPPRSVCNMSVISGFVEIELLDPSGVKEVWVGKILSSPSQSAINKKETPLGSTPTYGNIPPKGV